jgi:hypothetical protein
MFSGLIAIVSTVARRLRAGMLAVAVLAFAAGWTSAGTLFATRVNTGLVQAFNSVGQNLFGEAAFGAVVVPPNPTVPPNPIVPGVQMDVALNTQIPTFVGVLSPLDPCRRFAQLEIQGDTLTMAVDFQAAPAGFIAEIVERSLDTIPPAVNQCVAPPVVDGDR